MFLSPLPYYTYLDYYRLVVSFGVIFTKTELVCSQRVFVVSCYLLKCSWRSEESLSLISTYLHGTLHRKGPCHIRILNFLHIRDSHQLFFYRPVRSTAIMPLKNTPSNVPAPPMLATGAPSFGIFRRFSRSAPKSVPSVPAT